MSGMPWFRFYSEALADPKIMRICNTTGLPKAHVLGVWVTLLSMANRSPERGCLVLTEGVWLNRADIEAECGIDGGEYEALMEGFEALRMIRQDEEGRWVITNWEKRNFESDNATGRVRRWRGEKRERRSAGGGTNGEGNKALQAAEGETFQVAAGETLLQRECNGLDTDTDTETDSETETEKEREADLQSGRGGGGAGKTPCGYARGLKPAPAAPPPRALQAAKNGSGRGKNGRGRVREGPKTRPVVEKGAPRAPAAAERASAGAGGVPDPAGLTVRQIQALALDEAGWEALRAGEEAGKRRASVLGHVDRMLNRAPAAVVVYQRVVEVWPGRALWDEIGRAVGDDPDDLAFWERVVKGYLLCGWNKLNVGTMLEFYRRREIPPGPRGERTAGRGWVDPIAAVEQVIREQGW